MISEAFRELANLSHYNTIDHWSINVSFTGYSFIFRNILVLECLAHRSHFNCAKDILIYWEQSILFWWKELIYHSDPVSTWYYSNLWFLSAYVIWIMTSDHELSNWYKCYLNSALNVIESKQTSQQTLSQVTRMIALVVQTCHISYEQSAFLFQKHLFDLRINIMFQSK